jgi:hypothetical protein
LDPKTERTRLSQVATTAVVLVLWLVTATLAVAALLIARRLLLETAYALDVNPWAHGAIDKFSFVFLGICWLLFVYFIEYIYGKAAEVSLHRLLRSFALAAGSLVAFCVLAVAAIFLMV